MPHLRGIQVRDLVALTATFPSGSVTSSPISMRGYALGIAQLASGFTGFWLGAQASLAGGVYQPLPGRSGIYGDLDVGSILPTSQAATAILAPLAPYWFAAGEVVLWSHDGTGSGMPQTSARSVVVSLKS